MKHIGHDPCFLPVDPAPKFAPMVVAFSLFILAVIQQSMKAEAIESDFQDMSVRTANLFFLGHQDDEKARHIAAGMKAFQSLVHADFQTMKEWRDTLKQLIPIFVLQWSADDEEQKKTDFGPLFAKGLFPLVESVE